MIHSDDAFAPVGYLKFKQMHLEQKPDQVCSICELATIIVT